MTRPTVAARERRRKLYADHAALMARRTSEVSLTCQRQHMAGPPYEATTCAGLDAIEVLGCLCECHDKECD
jgi:hypothetical protein